MPSAEVKKILISFYALLFSHNSPVPEILFYSLYTADIQILCYIGTVLTLHPYLMRHTKLTKRHSRTIRMPPLMPSVDFAECLQTSIGRQAHITLAFFCPFGLPNGNCVGNTVPGNRPGLTNCCGKDVHRIMADV
jgi:hypothetical protein